MPIHMGIKCDVCQTVHFVATSRSVRLGESVEGMYRLTCQPPCHEVREFRKEGMHPYRVSDDVFKRGYAEEGEYELVQGISLRSARVPPAGQRSARAR